MIQPNWSVPANICAYTSTRQGGVSTQPYTSMNIAKHVGDNEKDVLINRSRLINDRNINWLNQTHSNTAIELFANSSHVHNADASFTHQANVVCAVMTADCLPVLLANTTSGTVAAIHAGWRGLAEGIIENTITAMAVNNTDIHAWLGPAIGATVFEVGEEVKQAFSIDEQAFFKTQLEPQKYLADIYQIARCRLQRLGVVNISGGEYCTYTQPDLFYSYRRDGQTGRMVSYIWFE